MPTTTFVYAPTSGDRVFASRAAPGVVSLLWPNGSRHAIGAHLAVAASSPGKWWRAAARAAAEYHVSRFGGIAWDNQGVIHAVVPATTLGALAELLQEVHRLATSGEVVDLDAEAPLDTRLRAALLAEGVSATTPPPIDGWWSASWAAETAYGAEAERGITVVVDVATGDEVARIVSPPRWGAPVMEGHYVGTVLRDVEASTEAVEIVRGAEDEDI